MAYTAIPSFFTREAAASSCVERGFEAHRATFAPPADSTCISAAVSVVTWRQAAMRTPFSGFSLANRTPMERSTGMSFLAHSMRLSPRGGEPDVLDVVPLVPLHLGGPFRRAHAPCPAAFRSARARSVFSHVNSGNSLPKCPRDAVFR